MHRGAQRHRGDRPRGGGDHASRSSRCSCRWPSWAAAPASGSGPFALTVVASVLVSLFISFTLDPMLSAYWGDPPGHAHAARSAASSKCCARFNTWFDHQADRYGNVIAWALHHRKWMALIAVASFVGAIALQVDVRRLELPAASRTPARSPIDVRTPSSAQPRVRAAQGREGRRAGAHACPRRRPPTATSIPAAAASTSTSARAPSASARRRRSPRDLREQAQAAGRRRVRRARRPQQRRAEAGADPVLRPRLAQAAWRSPTTSWRSCARCPGAVDVGLSEQDPKDELQIELDRGLANQLGISVDDAAQALRVAFAGVEVGDWVDPDRRDRATWRCACIPTTASTPRNIERLPIAVAGSNMMVPLEQIATITMGKGPAQIQHLDGKRTVTVSANVAGPLVAARSPPMRMKIAQARSTSRRATAWRWAAPRATSRKCSREMVHRAGHGHRADVPGAGDAVRLVHRAAAGDAVAAAVADRRGAGAAAHAAARST